jgi:hypothetical protein
MILITVGWVIGIATVTPETVGLYGVSVLFLQQANDYLVFFLRQLIALESIMVSVERTLIVAELPSEK